MVRWISQCHYSITSFSNVWHTMRFPSQQGEKGLSVFHLIRGGSDVGRLHRPRLSMSVITTTAPTMLALVPGLASQDRSMMPSAYISKLGLNQGNIRRHSGPFPDHFCTSSTLPMSSSRVFMGGLQNPLPKSSPPFSSLFTKSLNMSI